MADTCVIEYDDPRAHGTHTPWAMWLLNGHIGPTCLISSHFDKSYTWTISRKSPSK